MAVRLTLLDSHRKSGEAVPDGPEATFRVLLGWDGPVDLQMPPTSGGPSGLPVRISWEASLGLGCELGLVSLKPPWCP